MFENHFNSIRNMLLSWSVTSDQEHTTSPPTTSMQDKVERAGSVASPTVHHPQDHRGHMQEGSLTKRLQWLVLWPNRNYMTYYTNLFHRLAHDFSCIWPQVRSAVPGSVCFRPATHTPHILPKLDCST